MSNQNRTNRGTVSVEYGLIIGLVALTAAAMFAQTSAGIVGVWKNATSAASAKPAVSPNAGSPRSVDCMANAHGDSRICSNKGF